MIRKKGGRRKVQRPGRREINFANFYKEEV